jgi:LmbE family N-acetylglucosaminyl deacetylase
VIAVVSPHLDDGVLGCGARLAARPGSVVITVFAAGPESWDVVTPWDASCGFFSGDDVMAARRAEDREAARLLRATPVWLDFRDAQYGPPPSAPAIAEALCRAIEGARAEAVFLPLGLFHSDHLLVAEAGLSLVRARPDQGHYAYEDALYRALPGRTEEALARVRDRGLRATPASFPTPPGCEARKRQAVARYRSQLRGLAAPGRPGHADAFDPERYWRLSP